MRFSYAESMCDPAFYVPLARAAEHAGYTIRMNERNIQSDGLVPGKPARIVLPPGPAQVRVTIQPLGGGERRRVFRDVHLVVGEEQKIEIGDE